MTNDGGGNNYGYNDNNWLTTASGATITLSYDPGGVLRSLTGSGSTTEFLYDGPDLIAEYQSGVVTKRYVHGNNSNRNYFAADERGSIVAFTNNAGAGLGSNKYTPDGDLSSLAGSRFGYTGQAWLASLSLYYYKARMYSPRLASFVQPDPIGYGDGLNMYAYDLERALAQRGGEGRCRNPHGSSPEL